MIHLKELFIILPVWNISLWELSSMLFIFLYDMFVYWIWGSMGSVSFGYLSIGTVSVGIVSRVFVCVPLIQCNLSALKLLEKKNHETIIVPHVITSIIYTDLLIYSDHGTEAWRPRFYKTYLYRTTPKKPKQTSSKPRKPNSCSFLSFCCSH